MPKLSFLVSTYNSGHYLERRLHNLLVEQAEKDVEVVIVNPDSPGTDGAVAQKWADTDPRVNYIYWPKRETYGASWLRAWRNAKGEFVCNANSDDLCTQDFSHVVYDHMKKEVLQHNSSFGYTGIQVIDEFGNIKGGGIKPPFDFDVMSRECWAGPCVVWRNDKEFKKNLDWHLMEIRAAEYNSAFDYWLWLYFMSLRYHGTVIPKILTIYTQRESSIENSDKWMNNYQTYSAISEFFPHNFNNYLKHAKEFANFSRLPPREEWLQCMREGKKWK